MARPVPAVEVAGQIELIGAGSPLTVDPAAIYTVDAVIFMSVGKIVQSTAVREQAGFCFVVQVHTQINVSGMPLQYGVQFKNLVHKVHSHL